MDDELGAAGGSVAVMETEKNRAVRYRVKMKYRFIWIPWRLHAREGRGFRDSLGALVMKFKFFLISLSLVSILAR